MEKMEGNIRSENRRMLMHAQRPHHPTRRAHFAHRLIFADIPQFDFPVPASGDEFAVAATLHVDAGEVLLVTTPLFYHCHRGLLTRVEDADDTVTVASAEDVAGDLVRGE